MWPRRDRAVPDPSAVPRSDAAPGAPTSPDRPARSSAAPGEAAPSPSATGRWRRLQRHAIGALVLIAMFEALQLRAIATGQRDTTAEDRQRLVGAATSLLTPEPRSMAGTPDPGPDDRSSGPEARIALPQAAQARPISSPATPAADARDLAAALLPLQQFAQASGHDPWTPAASSDTTRRALPGALVDPSVSALHAQARIAPRRPIPELLEGVPVVRRDADALDKLTILGSLRYVDETDGPYLVSGLRLDNGPARVQLATRPGATIAPMVTGWLEVGDAPAPGWRVIRIDATHVDLLSPAGNPLRVRCAGSQARVDDRTSPSRAPIRTP